MKAATLLLPLLFASTVHANVGTPAKVKCTVNKLVYKQPIDKLMDINELLEGSQRVLVKMNEVECSTDVCENEMEAEGVYVRYSFNSQNGSLEVRDAASGQENYVSWLNEYDVTQSGYLLGGTWVTNRRGLLMNDARVFQIEADCWATDWQRH
jgi:hypothetical protein